MTETQQTEPSTPCWPVAIGATLLAGVVRFLPMGLPNFSAMGALALYGGARMPWYAGLAVPLAVMAITDRIMWFSHGYGAFNPYVYGCFLVITLMGLLLRRTNSPWKIGIAAVVGDLLFFAVTNFGAWLTDHGAKYSRDAAGLMQSYESALPFHRNTVVSTLLFVPLFFGVHSMVLQWAAARKPASHESVNS